ncbi:hypothetical protein ARMGADRAFT_1082063 [Armillaria gallica]|uniref:Uncharacterized protein n=1 Tax=Armillaria gallica TaxID=47427 RepID=A0A2H3DQ98_ARMGA|nr:hypothetical protein ARMGADRAFT_1082063 [Armillaria gallica]
MSQALYLLSTGKLVQIPEVLFCAPLLDLFNHFLNKLVEDPNWAITPAGMDYTHYRYSYILKEEARHFACITYNMIHQEQPDSPLVLPQWATIPTYAYMVPSYAYPWEYGPPGLQGPSWLFAAAGINNLETSGQQQQPDKPQLPSRPPALSAAPR